MERTGARAPVLFSFSGVWSLGAGRRATMRSMDRLVDWAVVLHVLVAFAFVAGMIGRNVTLVQARRSRSIDAITELISTAGRFDLLVKLGSVGVLVLGLAAMFVGDVTLAGNGWLVASIALYLALGALVPLVFIPRGKVFEGALETAIERREVTPELEDAFRDPAVTFARNAEMVAVIIIIALMVAKPF